MHEGHDSSHGPEGQPPNPNPPDSQGEPFSAALPDTLRNWQVLEIDGQATPVVESPRPEKGTNGEEPHNRPEELRDLQIEDRPDDVIVATLDNRRRQVACGETVVYAVTVLNNGAQAALFQVQLEGWLDPAWLGDTTAAIHLEPGTRATLRLPLSPPRLAPSEAGDYHFAVSVRSPQHPGRSARIGALLTVLPFAAVELRLDETRAPAVSWLGRTAVLPLHVTNRGNQAAAVELLGSSRHPGCHITFAAPTTAGGAAAVTLQPNQALKVPVRVQLERPPLVGLHGREVAVVVTAGVHGEVLAAARTNVLARPLVGPWQFVIAGGLATAGAVALLLFVTLLFFLAQRSSLSPTASAQPPGLPLAVAPVAPPVIIVNLSQPVVAPVQSNAPADGQPAPAGQGGIVSNFTTAAAPDPALPLVLPDQVSAPAGAIPAAASRPQPAGGAPGTALSFDAGASSAAAGSAPAAGATAGGATEADRTYGQMFQEIGRRFDLDWRMLAAQAYIESGFDSLALSDAGAMGLMQVLPNTWREWAVPVEVSDPFDAYSNVLVAAVYLDYLRTQLAAKGYPNTEWMLVAYNWGPDKVNNFLAGGGTWDTLPQARRQYATEILRIAKTIP